MTESRNHKIPRVGAAAAITVAGGAVMIDDAPLTAATNAPLVVDTASSVRDNGTADPLGPDGLMSFADALYLANETPGLDTITFAITDPASGPAPHTIDVLGAPPKIKDDLITVGPGRDQLSITNTFGPAFYAYNMAAFTLSGVTIASPEDAGSPSGGVIAQDAGAILVEDVTISGASVGIRATQGIPGAAAVTIRDVDVTDPTVVGVTVGGPSEVSVTDVTVSGSDGIGVNVYLADGATVIDGVTITDAEKGALFAVGSNSLELDDVTATRTAGGVDTYAGAVIIEAFATADIGTVEVSGATGGGLRVERAGVVTMSGVDVGASDSGMTLVDIEGDANLSDIDLFDNVGAGLTIAGPIGATAIDDLTVSDNGTFGVSVAGEITATVPVGVTPSGDVTVTNSTITGNRIAGFVSVDGAGAMTLDTVVVTDNGISEPGDPDPQGGVGFGVSDEAPALIRDSLISGNESTLGGGVTDYGSSRSITIENSTISDNGGAQADAMLLLASPESSMSVTDSMITGGKEGPVAAIRATGPLTIERSTISGITTPELIRTEGGGQIELDETVIDDVTASTSLFSSDASAIQIRRSTVTNSAAPVFATATGGNGILVDTSTITANTIATSMFDNDTAFIDLENATVAGNDITDASGGIFRPGAGQAISNNSIVTDNGAPLVAPGSPGPNPNVNYSLVPVGSAAGGTGNVETDAPGLGSLKSNGGPTETMLPSESSPAVDVADPAVDATGTDQRGLTRVVNGRADIGSVERQQSPFVIGLPPARVLETRSGPTFETIDGEFEGIGRRSNGQTTTLQVAGRAGVPLDAEAVVINVTGVDPDTVGFVTVHPCLVNPPLASSLNFRGNVDSGNEIVAELNGDGELCLFNRNVTDLVVDVVGYVPADSRYSPVGPARLLDTRDTGSTIDGLFEKGGIRTSGTELELDVAGRGGVSDDAVAVVINVTAVKPESIGFVTVHPCLPDEPTAASLNFEPGVNRGNEIVAQLNDDGKLCLYTFGTAQLIVDVVGQLSSENTYEPVAPARLFETRTDPNGTIDDLQEGDGRLAAREVITVQAGGRANVPESATGVVVNATAIRTDLRGFITVWDCVGDRPLAASLNYTAGEIVGNELVVDLNADGEFCLFTNRGTDLTVDVVGYLT